MDIVIRQLEIKENEGFAPEKDLFARSEFGRRLTHLVSMTSEPMVIVLDGGWGSGKTTFIKQWCGLLKNQHFPVIYFDAFANDFHDDIFSALAAEVYSSIPESEDASGFADKAVAAGKILFPSLGKILLKNVINFDDSDFEAMKDTAQTLTSDIINNEIRKKIEKRQEEKQAIDSFKKSLSTIAALISPEKIQSQASQDENRPLTFIIDELDRCKPSYALNALEIIKHFYSVKNVHFIIVTHMQQLESIVEKQYGVTSGKEYLEKFYDFRVFLKDNIGRAEDEKPAVRYLKSLFRQRLNISEIHGLIVKHNLSLRTCEKMATLLNMCLIFKEKFPKYLFVERIFVYLSFLRIVSPELYIKLKNKECTFDYLKKTELLWENEHPSLYAFFRECLGSNEDSAEEKSGLLRSLLFDYNISAKEVIPLHCDIIDELFWLNSPNGE